MGSGLLPEHAHTPCGFAECLDFSAAALLCSSLRTNSSTELWVGVTMGESAPAHTAQGFIGTYQGSGLLHPALRWCGGHREGGYLLRGTAAAERRML